jgi:hypothetical protein
LHRGAYGASLSRGFLPPQRYPSTEIHMPSGFTCPSWLRPRTYHVPRRLSPSADSLVSFQPGALTGLAPSELDLTEIASASRPRLPLLRLAILVASSRRLSLLWNLPTIGWFLSSSSNKAETLSLVDHWCHALWRMRHCCAQRPRFRGLIPLPVGVTTARFLRLVAPWLSWVFASLGRSPSHGPGPIGRCVSLDGVHKTTPQP